MRIPRLYIDQSLNAGAECLLIGDRFHYLVNVLRLAPEWPLIVFNGRGGEYAATLIGVGKKRASIRIDRFVNEDRESPLFTELAIGVARGERMDWVVQKATELGVSKIVPLLAERTEVKFSGDRAHKKQRHWQQVVVSACEQCGRNRLPQIDEVRPLAEFLLRVSTQRRFLLDVCEASSACLKEPGPASVTILVGPEGGFSEAEIDSARACNFESWSLGRRVLRTETAPVAALSLLQYQWGDLA